MQSKLNEAKEEEEKSVKTCIVHMRDSYTHCIVLNWPNVRAIDRKILHCNKSNA